MSADVFCFSVCWCANAHKETLPTDAVSVIIYSVYLALDAFWYLSGSAYFLIGSDHVKKWELNEVLLLVDCFNRVYDRNRIKHEDRRIGGGAD